MKAVCLFGVLALARILILACGTVPLSVWTPLAFFWQDILFVLFFAVIAQLLRNWPGIVWSLYALIVAYVAINVPLACELSTPLTLPILRAARGTLADSIRAHVTPLNLLRIGLVLAAGIALPFLIKSRWERLAMRRKVMMASLAGAIALTGPLTTHYMDTLGLHRNFFVTLLISAFPRVAASDVAGDWRVSPLGSRQGEDLSHLRGKAVGRNVVVIHLESTAARYLRDYGASEDPMPNLTALSRNALLFENAYTVFPETIKSFVAVHSAVHPALSTKAERYAHVGLPALGNRLRDSGYRTGLFHSGRFNYLGMDEVVRTRGFSVCEDAGDIGGERESSFGIDEESAVRRMLQWIDRAPNERFLVSYLPIAGHHPYATPRNDGPFPNEPAINRYRNALHYADSAVGLLLDGLRQRGLMEKTLFVVFGDHGQAFGQHPGNFGHTLFLYEENVHVPLVIAAPGLIEGQQRLQRVASLVDLMPTILDLLGEDVPRNLEGRSLLQGPERLALFCTDYSLGLLGLRDGRWKMIHELETGRSRLFDLLVDPDEKDDLADRHPERVDAYREHLEAWAAAERFKAE
jgi:phosphoglycerol transferase MdoB-like AlkP superfamily enzyme